MTTQFRGKTMLIVDDEPDLRDVLAFEFGTYGARVLTAGDGQEAKVVIDTEPVDLVLTDVRMPLCSGIDLLRMIRLENPSEPRVVLMTGFADISPMSAFDLGADGFLSKPFQWDLMMETLERLLLPPRERWSQTTTLPSGAPVFEYRFKSPEAAAIAGDFGLGRGGAWLAIDGPVPRISQDVALNLSFEEGPLRHIRGIGRVRWTAALSSGASGVSGRHRAACGVEFSSLYPEDSEIILALAQSIVPFVPAAPGTK